MLENFVHFNSLRGRRLAPALKRVATSVPLLKMETANTSAKGMAFSDGNHDFKALPRCLA